MPAGTKAKKGPKGWGTPEQKAFIALWMPEFLVKKAGKRLDEFWPKMKEAYLSEFPEEILLGLPVQDMDPDPNAEPPRKLTPEEKGVLDEAIVKREKQLHNSFYNGCAKLKEIGGGRRPISLAASLFKALPKRKRRHQVLELYQKDNKAKIQSALRESEYDKLNEAAQCRDDDGEWIDDTDDDAKTKRITDARKKRMTVFRRVIQEQWESEEPEVQKNFREMAKREVVVPESKPEDEEEEGRERTPEEYQLSVAEMFLGEFHKMTGWVGALVYAGPVPRMGGELGMKRLLALITIALSCSFGVTPGGVNFEHWHDNWRKGVAQPLAKFARQAIPRNIRVSRALFAPEEEENVSGAAKSPVAPEKTGNVEKAKPVRRPRKPQAATSATSPAPAIVEETSSSTQLMPEVVPLSQNGEAAHPRQSYQEYENRMQSEGEGDLFEGQANDMMHGELDPLSQLAVPDSDGFSDEFPAMHFNDDRIFKMIADYEEQPMIVASKPDNLTSPTPILTSALSYTSTPVPHPHTPFSGSSPPALHAHTQPNASTFTLSFPPLHADTQSPASTQERPLPCPMFGQSTSLAKRTALLFGQVPKYRSVWTGDVGPTFTTVETPSATAQDGDGDGDRAATPPAPESIPPRFMRPSPGRRVSTSPPQRSASPPVFPLSRPMANPPKPPPLKPSPGAVARRMENARAGKRKGKKKQVKGGNDAEKEPEQIVGVSALSTAPDDPSTPPTAGPAFVFTTTNNNRKRALEGTKRTREKEAAANSAKAGSIQVQNPARNNFDVVAVIPGTRPRRSIVPPQNRGEVQSLVDKKQAEEDAALVEALQAGKRKGENLASEKSKRLMILYCKVREIVSNGYSSGVGVWAAQQQDSSTKSEGRYGAFSPCGRAGRVRAAKFDRARQAGGPAAQRRHQKRGTMWGINPRRPSSPAAVPKARYGEGHSPPASEKGGQALGGRRGGCGPPNLIVRDEQAAQRPSGDTKSKAASGPAAVRKVKVGVRHSPPASEKGREALGGRREGRAGAGRQIRSYATCRRPSGKAVALKARDIVGHSLPASE
ncbi:hypothetical protein B0H19DRAFT_1074700 [Mycena capillaripes]|nr:hypothetical protein B0H19DRAFT_1074700 [Mycena capillaripes]